MFIVFAYRYEERMELLQLNKTREDKEIIEQEIVSTSQSPAFKKFMQTIFLYCSLFSILTFALAGLSYKIWVNVFANMTSSTFTSLIIMLILIFILSIANSFLFSYGVNSFNRTIIILSGIISSCIMSFFFGLIIFELSRVFPNQQYLPILLSVSIAVILLFIVLCIFSLTTTKDLSELSNYIFPIMIVLLLFAIINLFLRMARIEVTFLSVIISLGFILVYSLLTITQLQKIRYSYYLINKYDLEFKDFLALTSSIILFQYLFQILMEVLKIIIALQKNNRN